MLLMGNININPLDTDTDPNVLQLRNILSLNFFNSLPFTANKVCKKL